MPACKINEYTSRFQVGVEVIYTPGNGLPAVRARITEAPFLFTKHVKTCVVRLDNDMMVPCQQLTLVHSPSDSLLQRFPEADDTWWIGSLREEPGNDPPDLHAKGMFHYVVWIKQLGSLPPAFGYFVEVFANDDWFATCPGEKANWSSSRDDALAKGRLVGERFVDSLMAKYGDQFDPEQWRREKSELAHPFAVLHRRTPGP